MSTQHNQSFQLVQSFHTHPLLFSSGRLSAHTTGFLSHFILMIQLSSYISAKRSQMSFMYTNKTVNSHLFSAPLLVQSLQLHPFSLLNSNIQFSLESLHLKISLNILYRKWYILFMYLSYLFDAHHTLILKTFLLGKGWWEVTLPSPVVNEFKRFFITIYSSLTVPNLI